MCEESLLFFSSFGIHHRNRIKFKFGHCPENAARVSSINDQSDLTERLWRFINLGSKFTKEADGLPVTSTGTFTSEIYDAPQPFSQIRMVVNATNTSSIFWTMSEFKFYSVSVTDPEAADE